MSRYVIEIENGEREVVIGWDAGLVSYFAQVKPAGEVDADELTLWAGTSPGEIPNVEQLQNVIRDYIEIPVNILSSLESDKQFEEFGSVLLDLLGKKGEPR